MLFQETEAAETAAPGAEAGTEMDIAELTQDYMIENGPNVLWAVVTLVVGWWIVKMLIGVTRRVLEKRSLDGALRRVVPRGGGFDANFMGLTREGADLACRRLQARGTQCFMIGSEG